MANRKTTLTRGRYAYHMKSTCAMAHGERVLLFVLFVRRVEQMTSSLWSRKECTHNFGLWTAVNKTLREEYMRQLAWLSMDVKVLVENKALVPLRRLLRLRILDISGKLGSSPETHESDPDRIAVSLCHDAMGLPSHPLHVQHKETVRETWDLRRQWHSYLPFRACLASPRSTSMVSGSGCKGAAMA